MGHNNLIKQNKQRSQCDRKFHDLYLLFSEKLLFICWMSSIFSLIGFQGDEVVKAKYFQYYVILDLGHNL